MVFHEYFFLNHDQVINVKQQLQKEMIYNALDVSLILLQDNIELIFLLAHHKHFLSSHF